MAEYGVRLGASLADRSNAVRVDFSVGRRVGRDGRRGRCSGRTAGYHRGMVRDRRRSPRVDRVASEALHVLRFELDLGAVPRLHRGA